MMKYVIKFFFVIIMCSLFSEEITFGEKFKAGNKEIADVFKNDKYIAISPLLSPRVSLGIVTAKQLNENLLIESIYYIHGFAYNNYKVFGIGMRGNHFFRNKLRDGFYIITNAGFDYFEHEDWSYSIGGSNSDNNEEIVKGFIPNISVGAGYSIKVGNESFLRLNMDVGLKWLLANIYLSFVW